MRPTHVDHIPELLARFDDRRSDLVPILQAIQGEYSHLSEDAVRQVAVKLQVSAAEAFAVAQRLRDSSRMLMSAEV